MGNNVKTMVNNNKLMIIFFLVMTLTIISQCSKKSTYKELYVKEKNENIQLKYKDSIQTAKTVTKDELSLKMDDLLYLMVHLESYCDKYPCDKMSRKELKQMANEFIK